METKANNQPVLFSLAVEKINQNIGRWLKITMITQVYEIIGLVSLRS